MKHLFIAFLSLVGINLYAQNTGNTVIPTNKFAQFNKPVFSNGQTSLDAKYKYRDTVNFTERAFVSPTEANTYLPTSQRTVGQTVLINTGGTLTAGVITGGTNFEYFYKDGITNNDLVVKSSAPVLVSTAALRTKVVTPLIPERLAVNGSVSDFLLDPTDITTPDDSVMTIVNSAGQRLKRVYDYIDPYWFGVIPDDGIDDSRLLQKAIDFAIQKAHVRKILFTHNGNYTVNDVIIANFNGTNTDQVSLNMESQSSSPNLGGVIFNTTSKSSAALHIQQATGVYISNIAFNGPISTYIADFTTGDFTQGGTVRTDNITPNCAINIDGLYGGVGALTTTGHRYPGVPVAYYGNTTYNGSTNVLMNNCSFSNYYVGIAEGLSGCPNGENIKVQFSFGSNIHTFWAAGQLQSRENVIDNVYFFNGNTFISNVGWGYGNGDLPSVNNSNINASKYLFQASGDFTQVRFNTGYSEGMWSLGKSQSQQPVVMTNWNYSQLNPTGSQVSAPVFCEAYSLVWSGGKIEGIGYSSSFPLSVQQATFNNGAFIRGAIPFLTDPRFFDRVTFDDCYFTGTGSSQGLPLREGEIINSNTGESGFDETYLYGKYFLPKSKWKSRGNRTFENIGPKIDRIPVGVYTVTVNSSSHTATFTPTGTGIFNYADQIVIDEYIDYTGDIYGSAPTALGYVTSTASGTITLSNVPAGITTGSYTMYVARVPKFISHQFGNTTAGSPVITAVQTDGGQFAAGDRIKGPGIPIGAIVSTVNYGAGTITMTVNATATATTVELGDIPLKVTSDMKTFTFFGSPVNILQLGYIWYKGDEIDNSAIGGETKSYYFTQTGKIGGTPAPLYEALGLRHQPNNLNYSGFSVGDLHVQNFGTNNGVIWSNTYGDGTGTYKYLNTGSATYYQQYLGAFIFGSAPSGSAGTPITFQTVLNIHNNGLITIPNLAGTGLRTVVANAAGDLSTTNLYDTITHNPVGGGIDILKSIVGNTENVRTFVNGTGTTARLVGTDGITFDVTGGSGGDVFLANNNAFTGANTFTNAGRQTITRTSTGGSALRVVGTGSHFLDIGTDATFNSFTELRSDGRLDFVAPSGQMNLRGSDGVYIGSSLALTRLSDASSTATQSDSRPLVFENNLWNGTAGANYYSGWQTVASTTTNGLISLVAKTKSTPNPDLFSGTSLLELRSDGIIKFPSYNHGGAIDSTLAVAPDGTMKKVVAGGSNHITGTGANVSFSITSGAGTSPTISVTGSGNSTDAGGTITITTGAAGTFGQLSATLTYAAAFTGNGNIVISPGNSLSASLLMYAQGGSSGATIFSVNNMAASQTYRFSYVVVQ